MPAGRLGERGSTTCKVSVNAAAKVTARFDGQTEAVKLGSGAILNHFFLPSFLRSVLKVQSESDVLNCVLLLFVSFFCAETPQSVFF